MSTLELNAQTKAIFTQYPELKQVWKDNIEPPVILSKIPHEVCYYMGNTFIPVFRVVDGLLVEHNPPEEGLYTLLTVCDDVPVSLSIGDQAMFDYTDQVELPEFSLIVQELTLRALEDQLEALLVQQVA